MADVRCQMCGKMNPAGSEVCQFCQARITPLRLNTGSLSPEEPDLPDWLRSFGDEGPEEAAAEAEQTQPAPQPVAAETEQTLPTSASAPAEPGSEPTSAMLLRKNLVGEWKDVEPEAAAPEETPDWMARIQSAASEPAAPREEAVLSPEEMDREVEAFLSSSNAAIFTEKGETVPNWLQELGGEAAPHPANQPEQGAPEMPNWLAFEEDTSGDVPVRRVTGRLRMPTGGLPPLEEPKPVSEPAQAPAPEPVPAAPVSSKPELTAPPVRPELSAPPPPAQSEGGMLAFMQAQPPAESAPEPALPGGMPDWMAELKPPAAEAAPAGDDWLAGFGSAASETGEEALPAADLPDWMAELRPPEADQPAAAPAAGDDWLSAFGAPEPPAPAEVQPAVPADTMPDWMAELRPPETAQPAAPAAGDDWLSAFGAPEPPAPAEVQPAAPAGAMPDWMAELRPPEADQPAATPAAGDDWLSAFGAPETPAPAEVQPAAPAGAMPDWMAELRPPEADQPAAAPAAGDDWLSAFGAPEPPAPAEVQPAAPAGSLPDWMAELRPPEADQPAAVPAGSLPDWMGQMQPPAPAGTPAQPQAAESDWFSGFGAPQTPVPAEAQAGNDWLSAFGAPDASGVPAAQPAEEVPDWLTSLRPQQAEPAAPEPAAPEGDDWLSSFSTFSESKETPAFSFTAAEQPEPGMYSPPTTAPLGEEEEQPAEPGMEWGAQPDWLGAPMGQAAAPAEEQAAWLSDIPFTAPQTAAPQPAGEGSSAFMEGELQNWLSGINPTEEIEPAPAAEEPAVEGLSLEPGELPIWVQAMRPIETATPQPVVTSEADTRIENSGPLAGLKGAIPIQSFDQDIRRPPIYTVKLQVSDAQQKRIEALESLLKSENQAVAPARSSAFSPQRIFRWVVTLLIILAAWLPVWFNPRVMDFPATTPAVSEMNTIIKALPDGAPVLVAVDYEPALAGEMETAASSVLGHVFAKGSPVTFLSTVPSGPFLAQDLLHSIKINYPDIAGQVDKLAADSGYLPGGPLALRALAASPELKNAVAVVVLTDDADTARYWVEQIQPALQGRKLLMVSSAQIAPMLQPYAETGQIDGLISGISGGAVYEKLRLKPAAAQAQWDGYQIALFLSILLILGGSFIKSRGESKPSIPARDTKEA